MTSGQLALRITRNVAACARYGSFVADVARLYRWATLLMIMLLFVCMARLLLAELVLDRSCITLPSVSIWWLRGGLWENRATGCVTWAAFSRTWSNIFMRRERTSCFEVGRSMIKVALWVSDSHAARRLILKVFWAGGIVWRLLRKYI